MEGVEVKWFEISRFTRREVMLTELDHCDVQQNFKYVFSGEGILTNQRIVSEGADSYNIQTPKNQSSGFL